MIINEDQYEILTAALNVLKDNLCQLYDESGENDEIVKIKCTMNYLRDEILQWQLKRDPLAPPYLISVDLRLSERFDHPSVSLELDYLALIDDCYAVGKFIRKGDGLLLSTEYKMISFLAPGFMNSKWQALWSMIRA